MLFFLNDTPTTEISPLPLPDALPISGSRRAGGRPGRNGRARSAPADAAGRDADAVERRRALPRDLPLRLPGLLDRKSTRLNSSHANISYAVFCLKKKKKTHSHP